MSTLTATPDPVTGTVRLVLDDAVNFAGIVRADHNGSRLVRARSNQKSAAAGARTIVDYEPSLSGLIQYSVIELAPTAEPPLPAWTTFAGAAAAPRFILPSIPQFRVVVEIVDRYESARTSRSTFHEIVNRNDSLVAEGRLTPRSGSLAVIFDEYMQARDLENLLERGQVVMYRQSEHPGMDMYFQVKGTALVPDEGSVWRLSIEYVEVDFPPGDVLTGDGWSFDELAASEESFHTVARDFRSFHDLAIGQKAVPE